MAPAFTYLAPTKFVFGPECLEEAGAEVRALVPEGRRVLVICGRGPTRGSEGLGRLRTHLEAAGLATVLHAEVGHDPDAGAVETAAAAILESRADLVVAYGGGSPMDCAKSATLYAANVLGPGAPHPATPFLEFVYGRRKFARPGLPLVCVPTTAGTGSELSNAAVTIDAATSRKMGLSSPWFFPALALVDPRLQASMPPDLTAATGMDALTHALESFVSRRATGLTRALAGHAAGLILAHLGRAWQDGGDLEARSAMALASSEVAMAFSQTGLGLVHGFAHPVGARAGVAHGLANAVILPYVSAACAATDPGPYADLARAAGLGEGGRPAAALPDREAADLLLRRIRDLSAAMGVPGSLSALGLGPDLLPAILADAQGYRNRASSPRAFTDGELGEVLEAMYRGVDGV